MRPQVGICFLFLSYVKRWSGFPVSFLGNLAGLLIVILNSAVFLVVFRWRLWLYFSFSSYILVWFSCFLKCNNLISSFFCDLQERFTVVSYNILAARNALKHKDLYTNVNPLYLKWAHRKRVICEQLVGWNADIICLQEVDRYSDLLSVMEKAGYAGSYKRRTGDNVDGCAMFWKADKLRLLEGESIEFKALGLRDNVAQLSIFEICGAKSKRLLIGNIHVLYNPSRGEVKLGQIRFLLSRAQVLAENWGDIPVILAGDFNSTPKSGIYQFFASSKLNITLYNRRELSGQRNCHPPRVFGVEKQMADPLSLIDGFVNNCWTDEEVKTATGDSKCWLLEHHLKLKSSYSTIKGDDNNTGLKW